MKIGELMTTPAIHIEPEESVEVAARTLERYNIGALPVCREDGSVCGMITDRDIVTRCLASNRSPEKTSIAQIMTGRVLSVSPETEIGAAAHLMAREQVRRLPVIREGKLCGMVSLGDIASREETVYDAGDALSDISKNLSAKD